MQQVDAVTAYANQVLAGEIIAGPLVRKACERHLRDLETGASRGLLWEYESAQRVFDFFSKILRLNGGDLRAYLLIFCHGKNLLSVLYSVGKRATPRREILFGDIEKLLLKLGKGTENRQWLGVLATI